MLSHSSVVALLAALACLSATTAVPAAAPATPGQYNSRFDTVDVDKVLQNPRVLANYVKCVTDKGPCTAEGKEIKKILPDVLATNCGKCSPKMKSNVKKIIIALREKHPNDWAAVVDKYDPMKTHAKDLETFLKS